MMVLQTMQVPSFIDAYIFGYKMVLQTMQVPSFIDTYLWL